MGQIPRNRFRFERKAEAHVSDRRGRRRADGYSAARMTSRAASLDSHTSMRRTCPSRTVNTDASVEREWNATLLSTPRDFEDAQHPLPYFDELDRSPVDFCFGTKRSSTDARGE